MISFCEERFPDDISYGSSGGPEFLTDIVELRSGYERRNITRNSARTRYNVAYGVRSAEQLERLINFFCACRGRAIGFRFKDWSDYKCTNQVIGTGNGTKTNFQIVKTYKLGSVTYIRNIKKLVSDSVKVYVNYVAQNTGYVVNYNTGNIVFNVAPNMNSIISVDCQFDVPVRFDIDRLSVSLDGYGLNSCYDVTLIEVKL